MNTLFKIRQLFTVLTALLLLASCNGVIYDDQGDCEVYYRLRFRYDMNLKFADAFAHEVKSVKLFAFNTNDELVWTGEERDEALTSGNYTMRLPLNPGQYKLVAWCGLGSEKSFSLIDEASIQDPDDLHCRLNCIPETPSTGQGATTAALSKDDLQPLFHGMIDVDLPENQDGGEYFYEMPLTKDTNVFRVVLQQLSGDDLNPDDFIFSISDENGWLDYDNSMLREASVEYRPWAVYSGQAGVETRGPITNVSAVVAEMTVSRLFARDWNLHPRPMLTIRLAKTGEKIVTIPVIDYALLVKGEHHRQMSDQEYLDRADEYNMTFFLDTNNRWVSTVIQILSWRVVINNTDLGN